MGKRIAVIAAVLAAIALSVAAAAGHLAAAGVPFTWYHG